ncbi:MAG: LEA type 2 family protein [bacterium]
MRIVKQIFQWILFSSTILTACSSVQDFIKSSVQKPKVAFSGVKIQGLNFEKIDLLFDLTVNNPNAVGVKMAGFDYDFLIDQRAFVSGNQPQIVEIPANGKNVVHVPVTLRFNDVFQTFKEYPQKDSTRYELKCGFSFDLPVLGVQRIAVSKSGHIPLLKIPRLKVVALKLKNLRLTGADLELQVQLQNPNSFKVILKTLDYKFAINNQTWLSGSSHDQYQIAAKKDNLIRLPLSLNFLQIGASVPQLLKSDSPLNYQFQGKLDLTSSFPMLKRAQLPFNRTGAIRLLK